MVYTVTFNPAIDYVVYLDNMEMGGVNRTRREEIMFGGKGINVSAVLGNLGVENIALGFIAGFTGDAIEQALANYGIKTDFIRLKDGNSRINVKIKSRKETEINGSGPDISKEELNELMKKLDNLKKGDYLILAGSIPKSMPDDIYENIMERLQDRGVMFVVDATGDLMLNVLKYKPFLIKPNNIELSEMFGVQLKTEDEIAEYAKRLCSMGAENVIVSMADNGSIFVNSKGSFIKMGVAKGEVINSVGAGDSMVSGFIAGYIKTDDYHYALRLGTASGGATAFSEGLATKNKILELINKI